jgi:uncharacterized membrane protein YgcG
VCVCACVRRCNGAVELVDASEMLPDLDRRGGWKTWKVIDDDLNEWPTYAHTQQKSVPAAKRRLFVPSMWPASARGKGADQGNEGGEGGEGGGGGGGAGGGGGGGGGAPGGGGGGQWDYG